MRPHDARDQRASDSHGNDGDEWTTLTLGLPRWPTVMALCGRHPLVRVTDRFEAVALLLVMVVALCTLPIAGAVGTAVYDSARQRHAASSEDRQAVEATIGETTTAGRPLPGVKTPVTAHWSIDGVEHSGTVRATTGQVGDVALVWVDESGAQIAAPPSAASAAAEGVTSALLVWVSAITAAALLYLLVRWLAQRVRWARWEHALDQLTDYGGGPARPQS